MKIIAIGDIVSTMGRTAVMQLLPEIKREFAPDFIVANIENLAHSKGITQKTVEEIRLTGVDLCTSGNHVWDKEEGIAILNEPNPFVLRPATYPHTAPGVGHKLVSVNAKNVLVINLQGQVGMKEHVESPFKTFDAILKEYDKIKIDEILVDMHAEATSEKVAFGWYADGRASIVWGTHTHVPTADARILDKGTGYITDLGMTGPKNGILGVGRDEILAQFLTQLPQKHTMIKKGTAILSGIYAELENGSCTKIERIEKTIHIE